MIKLTQLAGWKTLNKKEKKRLLEVYGKTYSGTSHVIGKRELKKSEKSNG